MENPAFKKIMKKTIILQVASFLAPLVFLGAIGIYFGLEPFGHNTLLFGDMQSQYLPFFEYFKRIITGQDNIFYSFSLGMGDNFFPTFAYYLTSPLNFLFFLGRLEVVVNIIIALKIALISTSMFFFLRKYFGETRGIMLAFSFAYAFCGFTTVYLYNIIWLDSLYMLPLVMLAAKWLIDKRTKRAGVVYAVALMFAILVNYYLGYMTCIALGIFFIYEMILKYDISGLLKAGRDLGRFVLYSALGALMSAWLLLPTLLGMGHTAKAVHDDENFQTFAVKLIQGPKILAQLGLDNTNHTNRLVHLPNIYTGIVVIMLVATFFIMKNVSRREKRAAAFVTIVMAASVFIGVFYNAWHMFQETAGFPYRFSFILSFFFVLCAFRAYQAITERHCRFLKMKMFAVTGGLVVLYIVGIYRNLELMKLLPNEYFQFVFTKTAVYSSVIIFVVAGFLIYAAQRHRVGSYLVGALLIAEVMLNFYNVNRVLPFVDDTHLDKSEQKFARAIDSLQAADSSFYRISDKPNKDIVDYSAYNEGVLNNFYHLDEYNSALNDDLRLTLMDFGLYSRNERRISDVGLTPLTSYLLDVKYRVKGEDVHEINMETPSVGYFVPEDLKKIKLKAGKAPRNLERLAQVLTGDSSVDLYEDSLDIVRTDSTTYEYHAHDAGDLYFYTKHANFSKWQVSVDGERVATKVPMERRAGVSPAFVKIKTHIKTGEVVTITSNRSLKDMPILFDRAAVDEVISKIGEHKFKGSFDTRKNTFTGSVHAPRDGYLYLSIPYDKSWKATINGHKVKTEKILGDFTAIKVGKGHNKISLHYESKAFMIGLVISLIALIILIVLR